MKRIVQYIFAFLFTAIVTLILCFKINQVLPVLENNASFPADIDERGYVIADIVPNEETGRVFINLSDVSKGHPLALTINDMGSYIPRLKLYLNGALIYHYDENTPFQRVHWIELDTSLIEDYLCIEIEAEGWQNRTNEIITKRINASPKVILSTVDFAMKIEKYSTSFMTLLLGIAMVIAVNSIYVVLNRKKEYSYFFLLLLALVRIVSMMIDISWFPLKMIDYYHLHHVIVVIPAVLNIAVGVWLLSNDSMKSSVRFSFVTVAITMLALFLQQSFKYNWYHLIQLIGFFLIFISGLKAALNNKRGWLILCVGYFSCFAVVAFLYAVNIWNVAVSGLVIICLNTTSVSYIFSLLSCMLFITLQLTDRYNMSEELALELSQMNSELDQKVFERTEELIAAQERQKKMMMNIFHDLRNPVFILKGYVEKINEQDRYLKMNMLARLDHLQRLIDDLFLSEKLEGNEVSMLKDAVEIDELIEEVALGLETSSGRKIDLELEHAVVWADETRMNKIFENLIGNAILYTPDNTKILVKLKKEGQNVVISVIDHGPGISEKDLHHLFERYYTCSNDRKHHGTGLGLYIAHSLVQLHDGQLSVQSKVGQGTCFTVILPASETEE